MSHTLGPVDVPFRFVEVDLIDLGDDRIKGELPPSVTKGLLGTIERFETLWVVNWILRSSDDNGLLCEYTVGIEGTETFNGKNGECAVDEAMVSMEDDKTKGEIFWVGGDSWGN